MSVDSFDLIEGFSRADFDDFIKPYVDKKVNILLCGVGGRSPRLKGVLRRGLEGKYVVRSLESKSLSDTIESGNYNKLEITLVDNYALSGVQ